MTEARPFIPGIYRPIIATPNVEGMLTAIGSACSGFVSLNDAADIRHDLLLWREIERIKDQPVGEIKEFVSELRSTEFTSGDSNLEVETQGIFLHCPHAKLKNGHNILLNLIPHKVIYDERRLIGNAIYKNIKRSEKIRLEQFGAQVQLGKLFIGPDDRVPTQDMLSRFVPSTVGLGPLVIESNRH